MSDSNSIIIFNLSKKEAGVPTSNLKKLLKKYKGPYQCKVNKDELTFERLKQANLVIFPGPRDMFSKQEFEALKQYLDNGGNLFFLLGEGGEQKANTNINFLLEQYGINWNNDCVARTSFYKYFHPKESLIHNGILNEEVSRVANGQEKQAKKQYNTFLQNVIGKDDDEDEYLQEQQRSGLDFIYSFGATLTVIQPSKAILSSGPLSYPSNKPVSAVYQSKSKGKLAVIGSYEMFTDEYFEKEDNQKLFDFYIKFFLTKEVELEFSQEKEENNEQIEVNQVPDIGEIADKLKSCLQESADLPFDYKQMFNHALFKFDTNLIPDAIKLYQQLGVKHDPLTLIVPQFETPMLGLIPAVFPPILKELPPPNLELFDLDEEFALEKVRLAQLTNKCNNEDLDFFIREAGDILGVTEKVKRKNDAKAVLAHILEELVKFKKFNQG